MSSSKRLVALIGIAIAGAVVAGLSSPRSVPATTRAERVRSELDTTPDSSTSHPTSSPLAPQIANEPPASQLANSWRTLLLDVRNMDPGSDEELERLYARARANIQGNREKSRREFAALAPYLPRLQLQESFFAVSAMMRFSDAPGLVMETILDRRPPADAPSADAHHQAMTPSRAFDRIEAYAVRELRHRLEANPELLGPDDRTRLVGLLAERARLERSLDIGIEILQTLQALNESRAIETALAGHSRRDRDLMRSALD